ncbi:MAG TPA: TIGR03905 family protein [Oribacterium sp.]|jgi:uncharacterized protein (TIGR03905 family)|nr:TIGR03905 family protein [Oribacterium sp.]
MAEFNFRPSGVCSQLIHFDLQDGKLHNVRFSGGCDGNLKAIGRLLEDADAQHAANILRGNTCGFKKTSCADQLAIAIEQALQSH